MMYEVAAQWVVPPRFSGDRPSLRWEVVTRRPLGLERAKALADSLPTRATVQPWRSSDLAHDNGKRPAVPPPAAPRPAPALPAIEARVAGVFPSVSPWAALPRIVDVREVVDAGEGASCPHCGATGRWIVTFTVEGGQRLGAMRGCFARWPKHRFAQIAGDIRRRQAERREAGGRLASWDETVLDAIAAFVAAGPAGSEAEVDRAIKLAAAQRRAWLERRRR